MFVTYILTTYLSMFYLLLYFFTKKTLTSTLDFISSISSCLQGVPVAPLWDFCKGHFAGVLSALDFILILREVCISNENFSVWREPVVLIHL